MCMCNFACKGRPRNDLYCVGWDIKPYSFIVNLAYIHLCLCDYSHFSLACVIWPVCGINIQVI